jgi:hypothetical protein
MLDKHRRDEVDEKAKRLCREASSYIKSVRKQVRDAHTPAQIDTLLDDLKDDWNKECADEIERISRQIDRILDRRIPLIDSLTSWRTDCSDIQDEVRKEFADQSRQSIKRLQTRFERFKRDSIDPCAKSIGLREDDRRKMDRTIKQLLDELARVPDKVSERTALMEIPGTAVVTTVNFFNAFVNAAVRLFKNNLPLVVVWMALVALPAIPFIGSWLSKGLSLVYLALGVAAFFAVHGEMQKAARKSLAEARESTADKNRPQAILSRIEESLGVELARLLDKVADELRAQLCPIDEMTRDVMTDLDRHLERLGDEIRDVEQLI